MALTVRTNGSASPNLITAQWFNDYHDLLTGIMQDQEVTIMQNLVLQAIGGQPATQLTGSAVAGGSLGVGIFGYGYSYVSADGESQPQGYPGITTTSSNKQIQLNNISVGPVGTIARNIYRTAVGGGTNYRLVHTINDNTTTSYLDNNPDSSLGATYQRTNTLGGSLVLKDVNGNKTLVISNDGAISFPVSNSNALRGFQVVGGSATQTVSHTLGYTPSITIPWYAGTFGGPPTNAAYVSASSSTSVTVVGQSGFSWLCLLM